MTTARPGDTQRVMLKFLKAHPGLTRGDVINAPGVGHIQFASKRRTLESMIRQRIVVVRDGLLYYTPEEL